MGDGAIIEHHTSFCNLREETNSFTLRDPSGSLNDLVKVLSIAVLQEEVEVVRCFGVVDVAHDVRMIELFPHVKLFSQRLEHVLLRRFRVYSLSC